MLENINRIGYYPVSNDPSVEEKLICENEDCDYVASSKSEEGDICPKCNNAKDWWDNLDNGLASIISEKFIISKGLENEFLTEYVPQRYNDLTESEINQ